MRVDHGQPQVAGTLAGASTSTPATKDHAAEMHCQRGPAGESTGPASFLPPLSDTRPSGANVRYVLKAADQVEVWSRSALRWRPAVVERVLDDDWYEVSFHGGERFERSHADLRPLWPRPGEG